MINFTRVEYILCIYKTYIIYKTSTILLLNYIYSYYIYIYTYINTCAPLHSNSYMKKK